MNISIEKKILFGFVTVLSVMLFFSAVTYNNMRHTVIESHALTSTYQVLETIETIYIKTLDIETGSRGYALTENRVFLEPYTKAVDSIKIHLNHLEQLAATDSVMRLRAANLGRMIEEKLEFNRRIIKLTQTQGSRGAAELALTGRGKAIMDSIRHEIQSVEEEARVFMAEINQRKIDRAEYTITFFSLLLLSIFTILGMVYVAFKRDLIGRRKAEKELRESRQMLQSILDNAPSLIFFKDYDGHYRYFNEAFTDVFKAGMEAGFTDDQLLPAEAAARLRHVDMHIMQTGQAVEVEEAVPIDSQLRYFLSIKFPTYDATGQVNGIGGISTDITERKRMQEELVKTSETLKDLYDNAPCGYQTYDINGTLASINKTELDWLGYTEEELIGRKVWEISLPDHIQSSEEYLRELHKYGHVLSDEGVLVRKDGSKINVLINSKTVYTDEGTMGSVRSTLVDITERKQIDQQMRALNKELEIKNMQLEHTNQELEAFTYSVSHDLRAPLRAIHGFATILYEDYHEKLDAEARRLLNEVTESAKLMSILIDDLLSFSRVGRQEVRETLIDMNSLVRKCLIELEKTDSTGSIQVVVSELPPAYGDYSLIRQVWTNLISNAFKYSHNHVSPIVEISAYTENSEYVYVIKDNGVGFDMKYSDKLFGVFQRLHSSEEFEGTGVGLAIVKRIITKHGGRVWADGKVNSGATFYFSLPRRQSPAADAGNS